MPYLIARHVRIPLTEPPKIPRGTYIQLTPRMTQVWQGIIEGLTNKAIADRLGLSEKTVKNYASELYQELQVNGRIEAVMYAAQLTAESIKRAPVTVENLAMRRP